MYELCHILKQNLDKNISISGHILKTPEVQRRDCCIVSDIVLNASEIEKSTLNSFQTYYLMMSNSGIHILYIFATNFRLYY